MCTLEGDGQQKARLRILNDLLKRYFSFSVNRSNQSWFDEFVNADHRRKRQNEF